MSRSKTESLPVKRVVTACMIAATVLISLVIGGNAVLYNLIASLRNDAVVINISGRQRLLLEKTTHLAQEMVMFPAQRKHIRTKLLQTLELMDKCQHGLTEGDAQMGLTDRLSPTLRAMYFGQIRRVDEKVKLLLAAGWALLKISEINAETPQIKTILRIADGDLMSSLDAIVLQYQLESESKIQQLQYVGMVMTLLFIFTIILIGKFIFMPVLRGVRQSALRLADSEQRNRSTLETMLDGLITIDHHGTVQSFNMAAERMFAYSASEVIGNNIKMLMPEPYHSQHNGYLRHYLETGENKIIGIGREVEGRRKDGSTFPMSLGVNENKHAGEGRLFSAIVRDISVQKQAVAEMAAKNREIAIRNRYESSFGAIVSRFSASFELQEMLDDTLEILAKKHPFPASAIYLYDEWSGQLTLTAHRGIPAALSQHFKLGEGIIGQVIRDGQIIVLDEMDDTRILSIDVGLLSFAPVAFIAAPVVFQDRPLAVLVLASSKVLLDMDRVLIERLATQLGVALNNITQHQALSDLAAQMKVHSEEIKQKNAQLEQANRMKSEFLANMSHELRTPLNAIIGFSEILKDGMAGNLEPEQQDYVSDIFTSGKHLLSLINDILDLSKIEAGKMELELEAVNVSDMLRNSISIIKEKAVAHRIRLDGDFGEALDICFLDARKVKQIIYNLLSNAVKFTPDGGQVQLAVRKVSSEALTVPQQASGVETNPHASSITLHPAPLTPLATEAAEYLEITVSDSGIGISETDKKRLFTPFQQLESTLTKTHEGTGLGLVMIQRLAELHGGAVGMDSIEGEGSAFVVWLPYLVSEEQAQSAAASVLDQKQASMHALAQHHTVLVVEDDEKTATLMRAQLEDAGYAIRHAISAEQALDMLRTELPDLITLDILLPGMDGWDLLQALKKHPNTAHIPVVVVSIVADSNKGFSLGATDVLQKPVERQMLLSAIGGLDFSLDGQRVLVVDDDPKAVELVSRHLASAGCDVLKAYGGKEAIQIAKEDQPALIILDLMMPKVSGFDVIEALKLVPELARIPIIILTAKVLSETERRQLNGDMIKVMQKHRFNDGTFISEVNRAAHAANQPDHISTKS